MISKTDFVLIELKGAEKAGAWKIECATSKCQDLIFKLILKNWDSNVTDGFRNVTCLKILHHNAKITFGQGNHLPKSSIEDFRFDLQQECCTTS